MQISSQGIQIVVDDDCVTKVYEVEFSSLAVGSTNFHRFAMYSTCFDSNVERNFSAVTDITQCAKETVAAGKSLLCLLILCDLNANYSSFPVQSCLLRVVVSLWIEAPFS